MKDMGLKGRRKEEGGRKRELRHCRTLQDRRKGRGCGNTAAYGTEGRKGPQPTRLREKRERREDGRPRNKGYESMQKGVFLREIKRRMRIILQFACIIALRDNVVW